MNKLTQYGHPFQTKALAALVTDRDFLQQSADIVSPEYFDSDANKWLVKNIISYFYEFKTSPTLEVIKVKINDVEDDILKTSIIDKLKDAWNHRESTDLEFTQ